MACIVFLNCHPISTAQQPLIAMEGIQAVIQRMRQRGPHQHKLTAAALACAWKAAMPQAVQKRTTRTFYKEGQFFVQLSSAPLRQELQASKSKVVEFLKQHVPECGALEIVFL